MTKDEALKLALEHFETWTHEDSIFAGEFDKEITAIKEALAQPEPQYVAFMDVPQRTWVGLTDEEVDECYYWKDRLWTTDELVRHVEAKLKEKNNG